MPRRRRTPSIRGRIEHRVARIGGERLVWLAVTSAAATATGLLVERALTRGWQELTDEDEPPASRVRGGDGWVELLAWTAGSAAVVALTKLAAREGTALAWQGLRGQQPPE